MNKSLPSISIVIPTLNSSGTLNQCLDSIGKQGYPLELLEIIFSDGGSIDLTVRIIEDFKISYPKIKVKLIENKLRTGEAGKAAGFKVASGEIISFIDSDNILEEDYWLEHMVEPFQDEEIISSEPIRYTYREQDGYISRYCAMMGMNDPLCYFLGNYDRECILSGKWTEMPYEVIEDNIHYLKLRLNPRRLPTIGANGFFIRKKELDKLNIGDFLVDVDILANILSNYVNKFVSKVKIGIVHIFANDLRSFFRKQKRRISDFKFANKEGERSYNWLEVNIYGLIKFCLSCLFVIPLVIQAIKGFIRKKDFVWVIHPIFCITTFYIYLYGFFIGFSVMDRSSWQVKK